jgi:hypothetical protein
MLRSEFSTSLLSYLMSLCRGCFDYIVGWGQAGFYPYLAASLMKKLSEKVFVECYSMIRCLPQILKEEEGLGNHSSVLLFTPNFGLEYFWTSPGLRPFGEAISIQCPGCSALKSLKATITGEGRYNVKCKFKCGWNRRYTVKMDANLRLKTSGENNWGQRLIYGGWKEIDAAGKGPRREL